MNYLNKLNQIKLTLSLILGFSFNSIFAQQNVDIFTPNGQDKMYQNNVLIELFSSEGCSSCPIADAFMKEVIHLSDSTASPVFVIDYHVDYWNKSGWIDPFSDSVYTKKQMNYALKKEEKNLYTPMAFVNGGKALAGADKKGISIEITQNLSKPNPNFLKLGVAAEPNEDSLIVAYRFWGPMDSLELNIAFVQREINSEVKGGENANQILHHHNLCRKLITAPLTKSEGKTKIYVNPAINLDNFRIIGYVQNPRTLKIHGIDQLTFRP
jgi:hypothetical protein